MTFPRIAIVIVTYNRVNMLKATLEACLEQQPPADLIVVNNASTDGTKEYLTGFSRTNPNINIIHLSENIGGAGGFSIGMRQAFEQGYEWLWIMDDDVLPVSKGLQTLLQYTGKARCLYPAKECANGRIFDFEYLVSRKTLRRQRISSVHNMENRLLLPTNSGNFEGAFIHRDVIARIGLPDSRFFRCWDDTLFGMKAAEHFECNYLNRICIKKQFDKEKFSIFNKYFFTSSLFSRFHFFRNYWEVIRYLKQSGELSPIAYIQYAFEFVKALGITVFFERNPKGVFVLIRALRQGMTQSFTPYSQHA